MVRTTAGNLRTKLKESIFKNNRQINSTVTTRTWVLPTEWTKNYKKSWWSPFVWMGDVALQVCGYLFIVQFMTSWIYLSFVIRPFFYITKKSGKKFKKFQEQKELLTWNKKHFLSFLKSFQLSEFISHPKMSLTSC